MYICIYVYEHTYVCSYTYVRGHVYIKKTPKTKLADFLPDFTKSI